jgi:hypothetical protein
VSSKARSRRRQEERIADRGWIRRVAYSPPGADVEKAKAQVEAKLLEVMTPARRVVVSAEEGDRALVVLMHLEAATADEGNLTAYSGLRARLIADGGYLLLAMGVPAPQPVPSMRHRSC